MGSWLSCLDDPPQTGVKIQPEKKTVYRMSLFQLKLATRQIKQEGLLFDSIPVASNYSFEDRICVTCNRWHPVVVKRIDHLQQSTSPIRRHLEIVHVPGDCEIALSTEQFQMLKQIVDSNKS